MTVRVLEGDCRAVLATLDAESVQCCVTSPPYFGLRDYGVAGQLGLEPTPDAYVAEMVAVFREVRRVLKDDGTLWLNLGDCWANKQLVGIPWRVAFALQADGWLLRQCNVWAKPNGMPESVQDRTTVAHEYVFHLAKSPSYFYAIDAARTPPQPSTETRLAQDVEAQAGSVRANGGGKTNGAMKAVRRHGSTLTGAPHGRHALGDALPEKERRSDKQRGHVRVHAGFNERWDAMERSEQVAGGANLRSVWWLAPAQYRDAHFATMPTRLAELCIVAGSRPGDTVLDPFGGAGTTGLVADRLSRHALLIELNPTYAALARERILSDAPLFGDVA